MPQPSDLPVAHDHGHGNRVVGKGLRGHPLVEYPACPRHGPQYWPPYASEESQLGEWLRQSRRDQCLRSVQLIVAPRRRGPQALHLHPLASTSSNTRSGEIIPGRQFNVRLTPEMSRASRRHDRTDRGKRRLHFDVGRHRGGLLIREWSTDHRNNRRCAALGLGAILASVFRADFALAVRKAFQSSSARRCLTSVR
jgi:hypothetical protein